MGGGHAVEIAVPLRPRRPQPCQPTKPIFSIETVADPADVRRVVPPGGVWLYLKVYVIDELQDEILVHHLPELLDCAASVADRWFFLRYHDDEPHLRIRFHGPAIALATSLLPAAHEWAKRLTAEGLLRDLQLGTYRPEIARYGGPEAMPVAEQAFCADSLATVQQLVLRNQGVLKCPIELLLAANYLDLAQQLLGEGWQEWLLTSYPETEFHRLFQRYRREAVRLLDPIVARSQLAEFPGGQQLLKIWEHRGPHINQYGHLIRELTACGKLQSVTLPFRGMLHMHHNRLVGGNRETEKGSYAIARGVLQARANRDRHTRATLNRQSR